MFIVIIVSLSALLFTYLDSIGKTRNGMKLGFIMVTTLAAIHYDYGSDYMPYYDEYLTLVDANLSYSQIISGGFFMRETGWLCLLKFFGSLSNDYGFFMLVACLSIIQNVIYYKFIKKNVTLRWRPFAVFIYLFHTSLYILNFSMIRQGFVVAVFVAMWDYIKERKVAIPLVVCVLMFFIHRSSIILFPFVFWGFVEIKLSRINVLVFLFIFFLLFFVTDLAKNVITQFIFTDELMQYQATYGGRQDKRHFGLGFALGLIPLFLALRYMWLVKCHREEDVRLVSLYIIGSLMSPFAVVIPLMARLSYYFTAFGVCAATFTYGDVRQKEIRIALLCIYVVIRVYAYWYYLNYDVFSPYYQTFHTIFDR